TFQSRAETFSLCTRQMLVTLASTADARDAIALPLIDRFSLTAAQRGGPLHQDECQCIRKSPLLRDGQKTHMPLAVLRPSLLNAPTVLIPFSIKDRWLYHPSDLLLETLPALSSLRSSPEFISCRQFVRANLHCELLRPAAPQLKRLALTPGTCSWFVPLVLLMMELLVEVFLVRRIVADRSGAVLLVVVGCAFSCMCSVVAERVCLWCGFHWCRFVVCGSSELWVPCVLLELFLACSGGGFSQNFFVLVSILLPSGLRCVVGLFCARFWLSSCYLMVEVCCWLVRSGGLSQNGVLVVLVELFGLFVLVELCLDDSLSFLVEVLCFVPLAALEGFCRLSVCGPHYWLWEPLWLAPCRFGAPGATMCSTPGVLVLEALSCSASGARVVACPLWSYLTTVCFVALALGVAHFVVGALPTLVCSIECEVASLEIDSRTPVCVLGGSELWQALATSRSTRFLHVPLCINFIVWCFALALTALMFVVYSLKIIFHFDAVRREFRDGVRVNFFFAPWISCLLLFIGLPPSIETNLHEALWYVLMAPILGLGIKVYGQWMSRGRRRLSKLANPVNHLAIVGNFVGAMLGASMGLREGPIFFFTVGLAHYVVVFVTLYQRLATNEALPRELNPGFFLFLTPPSVASLAWEMIDGDFGYGSRIAFFVAAFLYVYLAVRINFFRGFRFSLAWWSYTYPMTAAASASIRYSMAVTNPVTQALSVVACAISVTISAFLLVNTAYKIAFMPRKLFPNDCVIAI
ncbi:hypothetical protein Taro_043267, partial [Colocasia esculenta]|nr:hypothetical protein [Colocasia esculenta]